jgi:hypothetical protein
MTEPGAPSRPLATDSAGARHLQAPQVADSALLYIGLTGKDQRYCSILKDQIPSGALQSEVQSRSPKVIKGRRMRA